MTTSTSPLFLAFSGMLLVLGISACTPTAKIPLNSTPVLLPKAFSQQGQQRLNKPWWQGIDDPKLQILIERGLANNQNLLVIGERLLQADIHD